MAEQPKTRQEIYDRIRATSKDEYVLEEMTRLGFWPRKEDMPRNAESDIKRRGELERELRSLRTEFARLNNEEALRKELRKRRMEESRRKQKETKERRLRERAEKAERWKEQKKTEIIFLGEAVSGGLNHQENEAVRLSKRRLPEFADAAGLAEFLGITIGELRFLAYDRRVSRISHYKRFLTPKKTGGERLISAPMPRLKATQTKILTEILEKVELHDAAHGFCPERSILSNARPHVKPAILINMDIKDFFPSVHWKRVRGVFQGMGYSEQVAVLLALLCTEPDTKEVELDGERWYVAQGERRLPQGSPASPAITNIICRRMDARLAGLGKKLGFNYTRYADDLTFSTRDKDADVKTLLGALKRLVREEGFEPHPEKTRVLRRGRRQEVTGLVVNETPKLPRKRLRQFRALLQQVETRGPEGKHWGASPDLFASMRGFAALVNMTDPKLGGAWLERVRALRERYG